MFNQNEINDALTRILKSRTFSKASTGKVLLKFLVESTIKENEISAYTIGLELFGRKYDPEKSDVNIRVNISHLRKRLKQYYEQEGSEDPIIIYIEPGQYNATFSGKKKLKPGKLKRNIVGLSTVVVLSVAAVILIFPLKSTDKVWSSMFDNELETTLFLGDVFGYRGPTIFGSLGWHRDSNINSADEFYMATKSNPEKYSAIKPGKYSYVVFENSFNIKPFTQYFTINDYDFSLRPTADFITRTIKDHNTIYTGPFYVQTTFNELFNDFSKNVKLVAKNKKQNHFSLNYNTKDNQQTTIILNSNDIDGEYAIASAFNGPNNSRHYMFFSNHGMGLTAIVEHFTNPDSIEAFSERHLNDSNEFIALFYVKGKDRTSMSMELEFFDDNK